MIPCSTINAPLPPSRTHPNTHTQASLTSLDVSRHNGHVAPSSPKSSTDSQWDLTPLPRFSNLRSLSLAGHDLRESGAKALASELKLLPAMEVLDLRACSLSPTAATDIAQVLRG